MRHIMIRWQVPFMHRFGLNSIYILLGIHNTRAFCIQTQLSIHVSEYWITETASIIIVKRFYSNKVNTKVIPAIINIVLVKATHESEKEEKQSEENWSTEGSGRGFLLNMKLKVVCGFFRWVIDIKGNWCGFFRRIN